MMQTFQANKGNFWIYIVCSFLFLVLVLVMNYVEFENYWVIVPAILPLMLFLWTYFSTKYTVKDHYFHYQSAFLKGKIDINKITKLQPNKTLWSGVKPALATKGIIIKFGYDEVYVAPQNNQDLMNALLQINPNIIVE